MTDKQPAPVDLEKLAADIRLNLPSDKVGEHGHAYSLEGILNYLHERGLLAPPPIEGWQPIDSAPTDGTIVLLAWPNTIKRFVYNNEDMPDWEMEVREYCTHGSGGARSYHGQATHWMPLPQPPLTKGKG